MSKTHTWEYKTRDEALDFIESIWYNNIKQIADVDEEGEISLIARHPSGWVERVVRVEQVDIETGSCQDHNGSWFPTHGTALEVVICDVTEFEYPQPMKDLFASFAKIFGGQSHV